MSEYFAIIWRNSGLEASIQSMQRVGALRIGEADGPGVVFFVLNRLAHLELELIRQFDELRVQIAASFSGMSLAVLRSEVGALRQFRAGQHLGQLLVADALVHLFDKAEILVERGHEADEFGAFDAARGLAVAHHHAFGCALHHHLHKLAVVLDVLLEAPLLDLVKRRLRNIHMIALDELGHVAEEEGEQQRANVGAVHIGVGHQDDLAVADLGRIEILLADAAAQRGDHGADFLVPEHLVVARLLHVQNLALERQNGLEFAIASLLGCAAGASPSTR